MKISNFKNFKNDLTELKKRWVSTDKKHLYLMIKFIIQEDQFMYQKNQKGDFFFKK